MSDRARRSHRGAPATIERELRGKGYELVAGVDEAGRGPIAGPVAAAAVIMPPRPRVVGVTDSKEIDPSERLELEAEIRETAVAWSVAFSSAGEIDRTNVLRATWRAMQEAVEQLQPSADCIILDGRSGPDFGIPCRPVVNGDSRSYSVAAASILAKVHRDRVMERFDDEYPEYSFASNKGYGTEAHRRALFQSGPCPIHRRTFEPVKSIEQRCFEFDD